MAPVSLLYRSAVLLRSLIAVAGFSAGFLVVLALTFGPPTAVPGSLPAVACSAP